MGSGLLGVRDGVCRLLGPYRCVGCRRRQGPLCASCRPGIRPARPRPAPARVDGVISGWDYSGPARALVLALKVRGERAAAAPLAGAVAAEVRRTGLAASALTWVPGRRKDIRRRGFDHARELALRLAPELGIPALALLERRLDSPDQVGLSAGERSANLLGAFTAFRSPARVALVDDLVTTGATATACAGALKGAGAATVEVLAACSARQESP